MTDIEDPNPLTGRRWTIDAAKFADGSSRRIEAIEGECTAAAKALDLVSLKDLVLTYRLSPHSSDGYRLEAQLDADVVQSCVITLEPVPSHSRENTVVELRPGAATSDSDVASIDPDSTVEPETLVDGKIDLGRLTFDLLSISLDPYPRKPGVELDDVASPSRHSDSPFAALAKMRRS